MPLDFPTSPTNGQTYQGYVYSTSVSAWQNKPNAQSPFYTSDTPPGNPVTGDSWFNTNDGTMYIYTYDGNTYQWVEHRSQIARSQVGLVPIVPTSVTVGSGTASVSANGLVTFSGCGSFIVNGIFSSLYTNYQVIYRPDGMSTADYVYTRFATGGTGQSANSYFLGGWYTQGGSYGLSTNSTSAATYAPIGYSYGDKSSTFILEIANPFLSNSKTQAFYRSSYATNSHTQQHGSYVFAADNSFDGMQFGNINVGNQSGTVKVYGYN